MKTYLGLICAIAVLLVPTLALAGTTASVNVYADVDAVLDLKVWIEQYRDTMAPGVDTPISTPSTMTFGSLTDTFADGTSAGNLFSRNWFVVYLIGKSSGRAYTLRQTANGLSSGSNTIPDNCYMMSPGYEALDEWVYPDGTRVAQGSRPTGSVLGDPGPAKGTNKTIYKSEDAGTSHIVRAYYAVTNGWKDATTQWPGFTGTGISLDQPTGDYSGSVTFSIILGN